MASQRRNEWARVVVLGTLLVAGAGLLLVSPLRDLVRPSGLVELRVRLETLGPWAPAGFVLGSALAVGLGVPRIPFAALGGAAFGWVEGATLAFAGSLLGCVLTFVYGRWLGRDWVQGRLPARLSALNEAFGRHGILVGVVLRWSPVGTTHLGSLVMALSPMSARDFLVGTAIGILPETLAFALAGEVGGEGTALRWGVAAALFLAMTAAGWLLARRTGLLARMRNS